MTEQVNEPSQCPNPVCRSENFDTYDTDEMSDLVIKKRNCDDCGWQWQDEFSLEFKVRTDVRSG
ncbi:hypothetical protein LCGC14_0810860 [marine sediment metagenome]|uniref:Uncharacterized protein n=1 Tax=marine sediment metagenome TaxID=412755 RepID=A0A0F9Q6Y5_9ZZZZ